MAIDHANLSALEARERLNEALHSAWICGSAESSPLALLLVGVGNAETAAAGGILERALRVHCARLRDVFIRRAHDEYAAILPDTPPDGARRVGEQIIAAVRTEDSDRAHRVSVGVAVVVPDEQRGPADLLRRAENALHAAREAGGDRCVGGTAAGPAAGPTPNRVMVRLRQLLLPGKKEADQRRRTD